MYLLHKEESTKGKIIQELTFFEYWDFGIAKKRFGLFIVIDHDIIVALGTNMTLIIDARHIF